MLYELSGQNWNIKTMGYTTAILRYLRRLVILADLLIPIGFFNNITPQPGHSLVYIR
jgi:hypothetical protein